MSIKQFANGGSMKGDLTVHGRILSGGQDLVSIFPSGGGSMTPAQTRSNIENATDSNVFTDADHTKLDGIEAGATADQSGSEIVAALDTELGGSTWQSGGGGGGSALEIQDEGSSLTNTASAINFVGSGVTATTAADGSQTVTIAGGGAPVDSVNTQTGVVVLDADDISDATTTNKFTTAGDISKLAGIEAGATADQTGAEIKAAYEGEADTNAFDDAAVSKLAGIEAGATADQSGSEIVAALDTELGGSTWQSGGGGGSALEIKDEGSSLTSTASAIDFVGAGVTATTAADGSQTVTIAGGGAVDSVNSQTGAVVLDADGISDATTTNKFVTEANVTKLDTLGFGFEENEVPVVILLGQSNTDGRAQINEVPGYPMFFD